MKNNNCESYEWRRICTNIFITLCLFFIPTIAKAANEIPVQLRVENENGTEFAAVVQMPDECDVTDTTTATLNHFSGYKAVCALQAAQDQGLLTYQVTNWGFGFALDQINATANAADWSKTWLLFKNLQDPNFGIDGFSLASGDELLLTYSAWPATPLSLSANTANPAVGDTVEFSIAPVTAASTTVTIDGTPYEAVNGIVSWTADSGGSKTALATAPGYVRSAVLTLNVPTPPLPRASSCCSSDPAPIPAPAPALKQFNTDKAIEFLVSSSVQKENGSVLDSALYSDWTAIAFAAYGGTNPGKEKLKTYLLSDPSATVGFNENADYARRAMALLAMGINPYNGTPTNYIQKLAEGLQNTQTSDSAQYNDDIFALFPLLHAGYTATDPLIVSTTAYILSKQEANGGWFGVDMTAAATQALSPLQSLPGVSDALAKAKDYLHSKQNDTGGFENVDATSWAMQAITAFGDAESAWTKNNITPTQFLGSKQADDGGVEDGTSVISARAWSTAYAIPAALGKSWHSILTTVSKPAETPTPAPMPPAITPLDTTTTLPIVTSTLPIVETTTTLPIVTTTLPIATTTEAVVPAPAPSPQPVVTARRNAPPRAPQAVAGTRIAAPTSTETITTTNTITVAEPIVEQVAKTPAAKPKQVPKAAFPIAVGATLGLGLYLGWRLLKGMV